MQLWLVVQSLIQLHSVVAGVRNPKGGPSRAPNPINWNSSYYSQPFRPCNTLRELNPVERMRAHGVADDMFRKRGPSLIVPYATKFQFPAYGESSSPLPAHVSSRDHFSTSLHMPILIAAIYRVADITCLLLTIGTAYFDLYGQTNVQEYDPADDALALLRKTCVAMRETNTTILVRQGHEKFLVSSEMCLGFLHKTIECGFKKVGIRNGEYAKYATEYYKKMLL